MVPTLFFYELGLVALVWIFLMLYGLWPNASAARHQAIAASKPPRRKRSKQLKLFVGLPPKPSCALCEHEAASPHAPRLRRHPSRCPRPLDAPAGSIPPGTSVPMPPVTIAAGEGE